MDARALLRASLRKPAFLVSAAVFLLACASAAAPILRQPGYELATLLGLLLTFFGALPARAVVAAARASPAPVRLASLVGAALVLTFVLPLPAVGVAILAALATTPCDPLAGFPFVAVIVPTAALLVASVGLLCAVATKRFRGFLGLYLLLVLASAVATAWPVLAGPQIFAFNVFAGYFPGPLYDESLHVGPALLWARLEAVLLAGAALGFIAAIYEADGVRLLRRLGPSRWVAAGCLLAVLAIRVNAAELGLETTSADVEAMLGGLRVTEHFRIHYPRERAGHDAELLAWDLEYRYAEDAEFLGVQERAPIDAYFYRSPQEKQRWVGAAETDFAKPWLNQFHLQMDGFPDPVAKHELAHVLAGALGSKPFDVCAWGGLLPNPLIIEGLATAADNHVDELTLAEWSHAMRALGLAPDLRQLLKPTGFFAAPANRAYTLSGAFLRHLVATYGRDKLHTLYRHGDFQAAYGKDLDALVTEWERANDAVPLDAHAKTVAARRFSQPSLFGRTCAREEAHLREELEQLPASEAEQAMKLTERLRALAPDDLGLLRALAVRAREAGREAQARDLLQQLLANPKASPAQQADAHQLLGELDARAGALDAARKHLEAMLALAPEAAAQRAAEIQLASFATPGSVAPVLGYFEHAQRADALLSLRELVDAQPTFEPARYLIGRRLGDALLSEHALEYLSPESVAGLRATPATHDEAVRLRARALVMQHRCDDAAAEERQLLDSHRTDRVFFDEWLGRCRFEVTQGWPVLPPPG